MSRDRRIGLVSGPGGVVVLVAAVLSVLAGAYLLLVQPPDPVPLGADGTVVLDSPGLLGQFPAVAYVPDGTVAEPELLTEDLGCRAETEADPKRFLPGGERAREVDGVLLVPVSAADRVPPGSTVVCDGPAVAATAGLVVGWGRGAATAGGIAALGLGLVAAVVATAFLAVGAASRRDDRA